MVDPGEVELAGNEEVDHPDCGETAVSASLALGSLEQAVDGLEEAGGLPRNWTCPACVDG